MVVEQIQWSQKLQWMCNTLFHQALAVVSVYVLWVLCYNYEYTSSSNFSWHILLSTLAYIPLMGEAIVLFSSENVWTRGIERKTKYIIHGVILLSSGILVTAGIALMIDEKGPHGKHFKSNHAITGLMSWIFILLSQFLGLAAANTQAFNKFIRPVYIKLLHNCLGLLGFIFGIVSLGLGLDYASFRVFSSPEAVSGTFWMLGLTTVWACLAATKSLYNQCKTIFS